MRGEHDLASILKITFMKIKHMIAASLLLLTGIQTANAVEWQMKQGPMITPWSDTRRISPSANGTGRMAQPKRSLGLEKGRRGRSIPSRLYVRQEDSGAFPDRIRPLQHHGRKRQPMLLVPANPDHTGKHEREKHPIAFRCRGLGSHGLRER